MWAIFKTNFFRHCQKLSKVLPTFYWLLLTLYRPLPTLYCLNNESTGSIQSYKCDGILRIRRRLPQPYQTTTPSRALLSLSGANNVLAIFKTNFFGHCHILSEVLLTFYWHLLTLYWHLLTLYWHLLTPYLLLLTLCWLSIDFTGSWEHSNLHDGWMDGLDGLDHRLLLLLEHRSIERC